MNIIWNCALIGIGGAGVICAPGIAMLHHSGGRGLIDAAIGLGLIALGVRNLRSDFRA